MVEHCRMGPGRMGRVGRRAIVAGGAAVLALGAMPLRGLAQVKTVKLGILHPMTGALSYSGSQGRAGALLAIEEINAAGGIKSMGGAKLDAVLGDAQSKPDVGAAEVDKLADAGVAAVIGGFASGIVLATTQAAARVNLPYIVDVGVADGIVTRGLSNTFRFGPGQSKITTTAIDNLMKLNDGAGKPARTVMIVHEDGAFGAGLAKTMADELPKRGFEILEIIPHPTPNRDFTNIALKIKAANPDLLIPANYYNEYVLLARTLLQQKVQVKAIYSVLGGAASNVKFVTEFNEAAQYIMDCNHWYDPRKPASIAFAKALADRKVDLTYETMLNYSAVKLVADALEHAGTDDRAKLMVALAASTFDGHIMPYGPTKFVDGQNQGAQPVNTQIRGKVIEVIFPKEFASAEPVFPMPPRG
ncbi:MAG TPA: ABC transporter substrate-binding protein [Stellaceae bacterium]|nr:ABC transporter substrate-binding protein [Stellaceae bacterium]